MHKKSLKNQAFTNKNKILLQPGSHNCVLAILDP